MSQNPYRIAAAAAALVLAALSSLHLVWLRSPWPLTSRERFLETVVGQTDPSSSPPPWMTLAVACLLAVAAWLVLARAGFVRGFLPYRALNAATGTVAAVLLLRGAAGLVLSGVIGQGLASFRFWDLVLYSPLTLALGTVAALVTRAPADRPQRPARPSTAHRHPWPSKPRACDDAVRTGIAAERPASRAPLRSHRPWRPTIFQRYPDSRGLPWGYWRRQGE